MVTDQAIITGTRYSRKRAGRSGKIRQQGVRGGGGRHHLLPSLHADHLKSYSRWVFLGSLFLINQALSLSRFEASSYSTEF